MKDARRAYELEAAQIRMQIIELQHRLCKHGDKINVCNWGHVGDLSRISADLNEILAYLTPNSALAQEHFDRLGGALE